MLFFLALAGVFFSLRLFNLNLVPIFADEAIYIRWAQLISVNSRYWFIPLSDGKTPLFMWLLAPLLKIPVDPLLLGRGLSIGAGIGLVGGVYLLTQNLFDRRVAKIAAMLTVVQPFLVFYNRLSLVDSLLTTLIVWAAYFAQNFLESPKFSTALILGLTWAMALLTKPSAGLYFLKPISRLTKALKNSFWWGILAGLVAMSIYNLQRFSGAYHMISKRTADYLQAPNFSFNTLKVFTFWMVDYFGLLALTVFVISFFWGLYRRQKKVIWLSAMTLIPFFVSVVVGKIVYPRYFLPIAPFLIIIISWGISRLKFLSWPSALMLAILWLPFNYQLITSPHLARLPEAEKKQYFYEWSAGYGLSEITSFLKNQPHDEEILVATEGSFGTLPNGLEIYFSGNNKIKILGVGFPKTTISEGMEAALKANKKVFLVANDNRYNWSQKDRLKLIAEYPRLGGEKLMFYQVLP
jgi:4-amino-4-deoxy-L-arabinose transferase-like glycosyltransferase